MIKPKTVFLGLVFVFFVFFLRWNSFTTPFERDEGEYAYGAWVITQGGFPYKDTFLQKPPMIIYTYLLGEIVAPGTLWFPRFLAVVATVLTAFILGKLAQKTVHPDSFWYVMFLYPLLVWSPINSGLAANTEVFMLLPLTVLLWLSIQDLNRLRYWFLSGLMASFSLMYKPIGLYVIAGIFVTSMIRIIKVGGVRRSVIYMTISVLGFGIGAITTLLPVIMAGAWADFWEQVVVFNALYAKQWGLSLRPMFTNLKVMGQSFWLVYLSILAGLIFWKKNRLWYLYLGLGLLAVFQTTIRHYYILLAPFAVLICVGVLFQIKNFKLKITSYLLVLLTILFPIRQQFALTPLELSRWIYGDVNPFVESQKIAQRLGKMTDKKDCVFVAGSEPQILYYAKRTSCTKFNITYPLIINSTQREKYQTKIESELEMKKPKAIVVSTLAHSGLWDENNGELLEFTKEMLVNYNLVFQQGGLTLYEQK